MGDYIDLRKEHDTLDEILAFLDKRQRLDNLVTCLREAAIGCAGFEAGSKYEVHGPIFGWEAQWRPGCNIEVMP